MKINVGQFNESFPPIVDGVANVVKNYAYWMNKKYGQCCVITPNCKDAKDDFDYDVLRYTSFKVPRRREYRLGVPKIDSRFLKRLKNVPFDIVHAHSPFSAGLEARSVAKKRGVPFVATFHTKFRDDFKAGLKIDFLVDLVISYIMSFYESADEVWAVNESSIQTLREYGFKGDVHVIENGCDLDLQYATKESDESINKMLGISQDTPLFMYIGQHVWQKNLKITIQALKILKDRGENFHMVFVGNGAKKHSMENMVEKLGLKSNVTFAGNIYERQVVANIYLRSSAMLFPSMYDTSSLVPREAAACGCPTVFVEGSSTSQGITKEDGFLIENTAEALADTAQYIINNKKDAKKIGERARVTVYRSWEDAIKVVYERYLYLIEAKKKETAKNAK